jgi:hypothetical protein
VTSGMELGEGSCDLRARDMRGSCDLLLERHVINHVISGIELCEGPCDLRERDMRGIM